MLTPSIWTIGRQVDKFTNCSVLNKSSVLIHKFMNPQRTHLYFADDKATPLAVAACFLQHLHSLHHGECVAHRSPCVLFFLPLPFPQSFFPASLIPPFLTSASPPHTLSRSASHYFYPPECGPAPLHANRKPQVLFWLDSTQAREPFQSVHSHLHFFDKLTYREKDRKRGSRRWLLFWIQNGKLLRISII